MFEILNKDANYEIFKYIDYRDIVSLIKRNKYFYIILNDERFWFARFFKEYGHLIKKSISSLLKNLINLIGSQYY